MIVVALSGRMGCGKSAVLAQFSRRQVQTLDADDLAAQLTEAGQPALLQIGQWFPTVIRANGQLNRSALADIIFSDERARLRVEALLYPLIWEEIRGWLTQATGEYVVIEIPRLPLSDMPTWVDRVLIVDAEDSVSKRRVLERDQRSPDAIEAIWAAQPSREQLQAIADDWFNNNGSLVALSAEVARLHDFYTTLSAG